jgi:hypothetical protein
MKVLEEEVEVPLITIRKAENIWSRRFFRVVLDFSLSFISPQISRNEGKQKAHNIMQ